VQQVAISFRLEYDPVGEPILVFLIIEESHLILLYNHVTSSGFFLDDGFDGGDIFFCHLDRNNFGDISVGYTRIDNGKQNDSQED
jgi:hypothetical protein